MSEYSLYCHTNKENGKKYYGITTMRPTLRWANGQGYRTQSRFYRAIKKYGWKAFDHKVLYEGLSKKDAEAKEKELIAKHKTSDPEYGYNSDEGGITQICFSEEHRHNLSVACKGREISQKTREAVSRAHKGDKNFMRRVGLPISKYKTKSVVCIETGKVYISVAEATRQNNIATGSISECCNGKLKTAGGLHWKFYVEE